MKKLIPLIFALALLAACGAETPPVESVEPSSPYNLVTPPPQTPPAEPSDETLSRELPEGFALPQEEFEPAAYYLAEPFGEQGAALLTLSADGRFTCRYSYWRQNPENGGYNLLGGSLDETEAAFDGAALTYTEPAGEPGPERFREVTRAEALAAWRDMPSNDELSQPFPERIERGEWEKTPGVRLIEQTGRFISYEYLGADVSYELWDGTLLLSGFTAESPDFPFSLRGLGMGSSLADVLASFPEQSSVRTSEPEKYRHIYGGDIGLLGTYDAMDEGRGGKCVSVSDGWTITRFIFDENDEVYKLEFWNSVD